MEDPAPLEPLGRLEPRLVPEASGIVKSRRHPGIFWVHNDSGNPPLLFAINADGRIVRQFGLAIPNIDWEDIAIDDHGHLYLGDIGNNLGALPIRAIYRIDEPDPAKPIEQPLAATAVSRYALPRDNRFDAEGLDVDDGNAIVIAKYLDGREAELFAVPLGPPSPLYRPAQPQSIGKLAGFTEPATGSDLDVDRMSLAVCSSAVTRIYRRTDVRKHDWKLVSEVRYPAAPVEGVCWDGRDLVLVAEGGAIFRITEKRWRDATPGARAKRGATQKPTVRSSPQARRLGTSGSRRVSGRLREDRCDHSTAPGGWLDVVTSTLPAADIPRATFRLPSRQTIAPDSGRFSRISPVAFNSRPLSLR